ncbi:hypothetical protein [Sporosarcina sp. UB5]|uniref:hypothetical protein n=1 Tax=Sporosarcina sp. UB5 TaxID=3047463 RepID=UPI003D797403
MKKKIVIATVIFLLISTVLLLSPYNAYHHFTAKEKVTTIFSDPQMREASLGDKSEITNVKYVGRYMYEVQTEENTFLIKIKSNRSSNSIDIFEYKQHVTQFKGY